MGGRVEFLEHSENFRCWQAGPAPGVAQIHCLGGAVMSVIAIAIEGSDISTSALMKLNRALGVPLLQLKSAISAHEPVMGLEIFTGAIKTMQD